MTPDEQPNEQPNELALVRALLLELGRPALAAWSTAQDALQGDVEVVEVRSGAWVRLTLGGDAIRALHAGDVPAFADGLRAELDLGWAEWAAQLAARRHLRPVLRPLAYCRPDNDQGRRR